MKAITIISMYTLLCSTFSWAKNLQDKDYTQDEDDDIIYNNLEDQRMTAPDLKIDTISEGKTGFQDSEEFKKLISQLNKTLENLKHQDEVYKKGKM